MIWGPNPWVADPGPMLLKQHRVHLFGSFGGPDSNRDRRDCKAGHPTVRPTPMVVSADLGPFSCCSGGNGPSYFILAPVPVGLNAGAQNSPDHRNLLD
jgi:hypothetical protein